MTTEARAIGLALGLALGFALPRPAPATDGAGGEAHAPGGVAVAQGGAAPATEIDERLDSMIGFFEDTSRLAQRFIGPSGSGLKLAATLLNVTEKIETITGHKPGKARKGTA